MMCARVVFVSRFACTSRAWSMQFNAFEILRRSDVCRNALIRCALYINKVVARTCRHLADERYIASCFAGRLILRGIARECIVAKFDLLTSHPRRLQQLHHHELRESSHVLPLRPPRLLNSQWVRLGRPRTSLTSSL